MNKLLLLIFCVILMGGQAAFADVSNGGSSLTIPSANKIYCGGVDFNRTLPGYVAADNSRFVWLKA